MASEQGLIVDHRKPGDDQALNIYDDGYLRVEHDNFYVSCAGKAVSLPLKEFLIFSRLARNVERVITSQEIWRSAWGNEAPYNSLSLRVHIHRLRRTLIPFRVQIQSMVGVGYRLSLSESGQDDVA
ncbi:MAG TPA: winged helix-turn-helix domain-containing protein [Blastocatellia bacterium]|nr:winged helix-turn-helix domain-containing protein [Blastocatellia bacterium]